MQLLGHGSREVLGILGVVATAGAVAGDEPHQRGQPQDDHPGVVPLKRGEDQDATDPGQHIPHQGGERAEVRWRWSMRTPDERINRGKEAVEGTANFRMPETPMTVR